MLLGTGSKKRLLLIVGLFLSTQSCSTLHSEPATGPKLFPAARYVKFSGTDPRYTEYIDTNDGQQSDLLGTLRMGVGPMRVKCEDLEEFGMFVRHANWRRGGYMHGYRFSIASAQDPALELNYFSFERLMTGGFVRGALRFRTPPPDGLYTVSVWHRKEVLLTTEFEFVGCD